jgi:hypothetical protein
MNAVSVSKIGPGVVRSSKNGAVKTAPAPELVPAPQAVPDQAVPDVASIMARMAALEAENKALKEAKAAKSTIRVSPKGAISVYGFGQWPVTLYRDQWERLFSLKEEIETFIQANAAALSVKAPKK